MSVEFVRRPLLPLPPDEEIDRLSDKDIERMYPQSTQAQRIRDARAKELRRIMVTAPHWKAERQRLVAKGENPDAELDKQLADCIARIHANVERSRVTTERERQRQYDVAAD